MKECMAQADSPKEASAFERMNEWAQLLFSNISTHYFIEWRIPSGLLKKSISPGKTFCASNRSS